MRLQKLVAFSHVLTATLPAVQHWISDEKRGESVCQETVVALLPDGFQPQIRRRGGCSLEGEDVPGTRPTLVPRPAVLCKGNFNEEHGREFPDLKIKHCMSSFYFISRLFEIRRPCSWVDVAQSMVRTV